MEKQISYTSDVANGNDTSVNSYILKTAYGVQPFREAYAKINANMTGEEIAESVTYSYKFYALQVEEYTKRMNALNAAPKGKGTDDEREYLTEELAMYNEKIDKVKGKNHFNRQVVGAMLDSLPGGNITKLENLQQPDEFAEMFGEKYRGLLDSEPESSKRLQVYTELQKFVAGADEKQQKELLDKKIGYERKSYGYDVQSDKQKNQRYDEMIACVDEYNPKYINADKGMERDVVGHLSTHKKFAMHQLLDGKRRDCLDKDMLKNIKLVHEQEVAALQNMKPAEFATRLDNNLRNRMTELERQVELNKQVKGHGI